jgi:hypothetical protein
MVAGGFRLPTGAPSFHDNNSRMEQEAEQREYPEYVLPHAEFGDPECPGLFFPLPRVGSDQIDIMCNDCGWVIKTVPAADLTRTQDEMQLTLAVASEQCPFCGSVNLFPGFDSMNAYVCRECGEGVLVSRTIQCESSGRGPLSPFD